MTKAERESMLSLASQYGKQIDLTITHGEDAYTSKDIVSCAITTEGSLFTSVMRQAKIELDVGGDAAYAATMVRERIKIALSVSFDGESQMRDFGTFIIKEATYDDAYGSITLTCYDLMLLSMVEYIPPDITYPITVGNYYAAICNQIGVSVGSLVFANSEVEIEEEKYDGSYNYRSIFSEIAQVAGGTIGIVDDRMAIIYPSDSEITIDPSNLKSIKMDGLYGPVNSVVIARTPQEDNIYKRDETAESWCEIKIENNQIMDSHREDFIDSIYNAVYGLSFYPGEIESFGILCFDFCDRLTVETLDGQQYSALYLTSEINVNQGLSENFKADIPGSTKTDYKAASDSDRKLNRTILRVDKQEQRIEAVVENVAELDQKTEAMSSRIDQTSEKIETEVSRIDTEINGTAEIIQKMQSNITQLDNEVSVTIRSEITEIQGDTDDLKQKTQELEKKVSIKEDGLTISAGDNAPHFNADNDSVTIVANGQERFRADEQGVTTPKLNAEEVHVGNFAWVSWDYIGSKRFSLRKVG